MKKEQKEKVDKKQPSPAMVKNIIDDMKKYKNYDEFLYAKNAMYKKEGKDMIVYFPREQCGDYESVHIKKYNETLDDEFVFIDYALFEKDFFLPRFFFNEIYSKNKNIYNDKTISATEFLEKYPEKSSNVLFNKA